MGVVRDLIGPAPKAPAFRWMDYPTRGVKESHQVIVDPKPTPEFRAAAYQAMRDDERARRRDRLRRRREARESARELGLDPSEHTTRRAGGLHAMYLGLKGRRPHASRRYAR